MIAVLRDPNGPDVESESRDLEEAARAIGHQVLMVNAANEREFHAAFAKVVQAGAGGLLIGSGPFFLSQRRQLVAARWPACPAAARPARYLLGKRQWGRCSKVNDRQKRPGQICGEELPHLGSDLEEPVVEEVCGL